MINIVGIASVIIFYLLILAVGMWAAKKNDGNEDQEEEVMVAGRNIGVFVGIFTMTATWVGGGYINGTAEVVFRDGMVWCQAPVGYALSLLLGGIFFARRMRREGYVTMLDPLQDCLGDRMGGLLFIPALCGEVFWSAGILAALGATLAIIIQMHMDLAVVMSALIAIFYTWFGGLYAVAYTDVVQLGCILVGLVICIPFAWTHEAVTPITMDSQDWIGSIPEGYGWYYADYMLLLTFGGIPWQVYFQRVLSSRTEGGAELISYVAALGCILMAVPPVLIGAVAKSTNWNETDYEGPLPITSDNARMILPMVLQHLTPAYISFFGLGAVSAAVMSSADSSVLSASSMFARNVYKLIFRQGASDNEIMWVMRVAIIIVGAMATAMALTIPTIYGLWTMCSDLVYVILFPQLLIVVHFKEHCNTYGSLFAYLLGGFIRLAGGEKTIYLPALIHYPMYDEESGDQLFPFRTMAMLTSMVSLIVISKLSKWVFTTGKLPLAYDWFGCFAPPPEADAEEMRTLRSDGDKLFGPAEDGVVSAACPESTTVVVPIRKLERKPDPSVRELRRQISFGSGFGSLKKGATPSLGQAGKSHSMDPNHPQQGSFEHPTSLVSPPPPIEEDGESFAAKNDMLAGATGVTTPSPTEVAKRRLRSEDRKDSLKNLKENIKEGISEMKQELKETVKHLPDGHRGSLAAVVERPPYKPIRPTPSDNSLDENSKDQKDKKL